MLNSSLRRVARSCKSPSLSSRPATPPIVVPSLTSGSHQRRHSSSKPPVPPNNGSHPITTAVKTVGTSEKRPGAESRLSKRKAPKDKVEQDEWTKSLPSVPSTQYLSEKDVCLASFFSMHKPISITSPIPPSVSSDDFEKIFQIRPKPSRTRPGPQEVIYTITSAVENLDENISEQQQKGGQPDQAVRQRADLIAALTQNNNGSIAQIQQQPDSQAQQVQQAANGVKIVIQEIARRFRPYNPPPAPVAMADSELTSQDAEVATEAEHGDEQQARALEVQIESQDNEHDKAPQIQTVVLDMHTPTDQTNGEQYFISQEIMPPMPTIQDPETQPPHHYPTSETVEHNSEDSQPANAPQSSSYLDRRRQRQRDMYAISVKRQRRIKMKRHKLRKLRRSTRNLRRKLDKL